MANANKARGTRWESAVRDAAKAHGLSASRVIAQGEGDVGDVHLAGMFVVQAKDVAKHDFGGWVDDVREQRDRAGLPYAVVAVKRRGKGADEGYAVMALGEYLDLAHRLSFAEDLLRSVPHAAAAYWRDTPG